MDEFVFTLALNVESLTDSQRQTLYNWVRDSTASERDGRAYISLDRDAPDFPSAVVGAIEDVERALPAVDVIAVEPEELVREADIAARRGRSRESISQLVKGERGAGDFPRPRHIVGDRGFWRWHEVEAWFDAHEGREPQARRDAFVEAVNAVVAMRHARPALDRHAWEAVRRLAKEEQPLTA